MDPLESQFVYLSRVQSKYIRCALHFAFLSLHLQAGIIPRELFLISKPSAIDSNAVLENTWRRATQITSLHLVAALASHYQSRQAELFSHLYKMLFIFQHKTGKKDQRRILLFLRALYLQAKTTWILITQNKTKKILHELQEQVQTMGTLPLLLTNFELSPLCNIYTEDIRRSLKRPTYLQVNWGN